MVQAPAISVVMPTVPVVSSSVKTGITGLHVTSSKWKPYPLALYDNLFWRYCLHFAFRIPRDKKNNKKSIKKTYRDKEKNAKCIYTELCPVWKEAGRFCCCVKTFSTQLCKGLVNLTFSRGKSRSILDILSYLRHLLNSAIAINVSYLYVF